MLKTKKIRAWILYILVVLAIAILIYVPRTIGLADNSDFNRTMRAFGLSSVSGIKYFSAEYLYNIANPTSLGRYFIRIFLPVQHNPAEYYSTQFIFVKVALFFNAAANKLLRRDPSLFNLVFQTMSYILIYAVAMALFLKKKWRIQLSADLSVKIVFAVIFLDCGYLVYFNSFYGESTTLIFLIMAFVLLFYLERNDDGYWVYAGLLLSLFLFSGSKAANFPSTLLLSIPLAYYAIKKEKLGKKIMVCVSIVVMLVASYRYVMIAPEWMTKMTTFQSVFFGVLYKNPSPEKAAEDLGLPRELSKLEALNANVRHPLNPYYKRDPDFKSSFFDRVGKFGVFKYYLTHPSFFAAKLDESAEAALPLRPTYLSNINLSSERTDLRFAFRWNVWESIRKQAAGFASVFIGVVSVLYVANVVSLVRKREDFYRILLRLALLCAAAGQFIVPIVSNGNADLQKHMFLFNVHFDMLIVVLLLDNLDYRSRTFRRIALAVAAILAIIAFYPGSPGTVTLGRLDDKPIEWYVLDRRDDRIKVIAKNALYRRAYDERSNDYSQASIRTDLNAKANEWFTPEERSRILWTEYPALCNESNSPQSEKGDRPHYWFSPIKYVSQDSNRAYRKMYSAYLTLPSVDDAEKLFKLSKLAAVATHDYWLSAPYYNSTDMARVVSSDYQVYHRKVDTVLGVRPVMWVKLR